MADIVKYYSDMYAHQHSEPATVRITASLFRQLCYENKDSLSAGIIVAGWDKYHGGEVYSVPLGGSLHKQPFAIGGSGSTFIYGYCDGAYRDGMSKQECIQFVSTALSHAMDRDGSSGGVIRMAVITQHGVERLLLSGQEIPQHYQD